MYPVSILKEISYLVKRTRGVMVCVIKPQIGFCCFSTKFFNYLTFQSFDFERTRWRLFQKRVVRTKFDIYVCIISACSTEWEIVEKYWSSHNASTIQHTSRRSRGQAKTCAYFYLNERSSAHFFHETNTKYPSLKRDSSKGMTLT